ncbi:MAG: TatD family hydrolase [Mariprofundaceae bacterium]
MRLVDSHCHVDFSHFNDDRDAVLERFSSAGGRWLLAVAVDLENIQRLFKLAESDPNIYCSVGLHPNHEVEEEPTTELLCELARNKKCVAIGETGVDFFRNQVPARIQELRFRTHIRAAQALRKPVIVHNRDADEVTIRVMKEEVIEHCGGIMHCFSSDWETAEQALDMGLSISFSGNVTFKKNEALRNVARKVPEDMLLIETDSPYLAPVPKRGKRNEPAYVRHVAECLAEIRGVSLESLAESTTNNAHRRFGVK